MALSAMSAPKPNAAGLRRTIGRDLAETAELYDPPPESVAANLAAALPGLRAAAAGSVKETKESEGTVKATASAVEEVIREVGIKVDRCNVQRCRCNARPTLNGALHTRSA